MGHAQVTPLELAIAEAEARGPRRTARHVVVTLSECPPSVNNMFAHVGRQRYTTAEYRAWKARMADEVMKLQAPPMVRGEVAIGVRVRRPQKRIDLDNLLKASFDLLVKCRVIEDDRYVVALGARWDATITGTILTVRGVDLPRT